MSLATGIAMANVLPSRRQGADLVYQGNESVMTAAVSKKEELQGTLTNTLSIVQRHLSHASHL